MKTETKTHLHPFVKKVVAEDVIPFERNDLLELVNNLFNRTGDFSKDMTHAILGIQTEAFEMETATDDTHRLEEIGDGIFFFTAMMVVAVEMVQKGRLPMAEIDRVEVFLAAVEEEFQVALRDGTDFFKLVRAHNVEALDILKKWVGYGKQPVDQMPRLLAISLSTLLYGIELAMTAMHRTDFNAVVEEAIDMNIAKLNKRYSLGKFDADSALNRDTAAERQALESASKSSSNEGEDGIKPDTAYKLYGNDKFVEASE